MILSQEVFKKVEDNFRSVAREIDKTLFDYHFGEADSEDVVECLLKYQNRDGGFGKALEPDFRLPYSSAMATSIALRILYQINDRDVTESMILSSVDYLECTFEDELSGWYSVPPEVNDFPHAPWWHYDSDEGITVIDRYWGNPNAEIFAYLYAYQDLLDTIDIGLMVERAIDRFVGREEYGSPHEIYCYQRLYEVLPKKLSKRMEDSLALAIGQNISIDTKEWGGYVPRPLDFVPSPKSNHFGVSKEHIDLNLDYIIDILNERSIIGPHWGTDIYSEAMKTAEGEWKGNLTLRSLKLLDRFSRIEK